MLLDRPLRKHECNLASGRRLPSRPGVTRMGSVSALVHARKPGRTLPAAQIYIRFLAELR
jgi:hypothetical protein